MYHGAMGQPFAQAMNHLVMGQPASEVLNHRAMSQPAAQGINHPLTSQPAAEPQRAVDLKLKLSNKGRLWWTPELHGLFLDAVQELGGFFSKYT